MSDSVEAKAWELIRVVLKTLEGIDEDLHRQAVMMVLSQVGKRAARP